MASERLGTILQEWYKLSLGERTHVDNAFFKFICLWVAFNAMYSFEFPNETHDAKKVEKYSLLQDVIDKHGLLVSSNKEYKTALEYLKTHSLKGRGVKELSDINNFNMVLTFIYKIRCNLFHGEKYESNTRDKRLVENAYLILLNVIKDRLESKFQEK